MTDAGRDCLADLSTAPIFDDQAYLQDALLLPPGEHEDNLDVRLALAARESGVEDPHVFLMPGVQDISTSMSNMSLQTEQRSSVSVHSRETQSTAFTSLPSRSSRDNPPIEQSPVSRMPPPLVRASLSLDRDHVTPHDLQSSMRHRHSSPGISATDSVQSNPSSMRTLSGRKPKRSARLFSMFKKDTRVCSSRSHHAHHFKPQTPKLECGHSLSKYAIRVHVQEALERKDGAPPTCCSQPLPRHVLEMVLTDPEVDLVAESILPSPDSTSLRGSGYSEDGTSSVDLPHILETRSLATKASTAPATPTCQSIQEDEALLDSALEDEAFQNLKREQREQFRRVSAFEARQRKALSAHHQCSLKRLAAQLETSKIEKAEQHVRALERLEEFQLVAEHDLRNAHATETQNVATAVKYMEAYCLGPKSAYPEVMYTVTDEDRKKLERQHTIQEKLPAKHDSAINVLRAKQERDTKLRLQKQQTELQQLQADHDKEKRAQELEYVKHCSQLDALMQTRRTRLIRRWNLKFEIWRRRWEKESGNTLHGRLPHEDWPEMMDMEAPVDPSSSLALYTQPFPATV